MSQYPPSPPPIRVKCTLKDILGPARNIYAPSLSPNNTNNVLYLHFLDLWDMNWNLRTAKSKLFTGLHDSKLFV
jgi:hypothetical protein